KRLAKEGIAVASANYRLTDVASYPAQMHDAARAIQFLRHNAEKYNLDPARVAATGVSAGAGISLWLAFHDNLADPKAEDPIARQSTRLTCAVPTNGQCTYDPRVIKRIVPGKAYNAENALIRLFGVARRGDWDKVEIDEKLDALIKDGSPIHHLSKDDPPVLVINSASKAEAGNIHHPNFGKHLEAEMKKLGLECTRRLDTDYRGENKTGFRSFNEEQAAFLKRHFGLSGTTGGGGGKGNR
ncbi:MAG: alpha/beta hydrolase fold domain-containing protein, partial [Planctomycetota bacterium]